jgi:hypothetical protein
MSLSPANGPFNDTIANGVIGPYIRGSLLTAVPSHPLCHFPLSLTPIGSHFQPFVGASILLGYTNPRLGRNITRVSYDYIAYNTTAAAVGPVISTTDLYGTTSSLAGELVSLPIPRVCNPLSPEVPTIDPLVIFTPSVPIPADAFTLDILFLNLPATATVLLGNITLVWTNENGSRNSTLVYIEVHEPVILTGVNWICSANLCNNE